MFEKEQVPLTNESVRTDQPLDFPDDRLLIALIASAIPRPSVRINFYLAFKQILEHNYFFSDLEAADLGGYVDVDFCSGLARKVSEEFGEFVEAWDRYDVAATHALQTAHCAKEPDQTHRLNELWDDLALEVADMGNVILALICLHQCKQAVEILSDVYVLWTRTLDPVDLPSFMEHGCKLKTYIYSSRPHCRN